MVHRLDLDSYNAFIFEPIQGEGGINVADKEYIKALRDICDKRDMLLIFDEVQTGMGRTGEVFCFKHYGIEPDVITLAKSLGGGLPIGAMVAGGKFADVLTSGTHASTFGGSPVVCASALAVFEAIEKDGLIENTREMGVYLKAELQGLASKHNVITGIKGMGLMLGVVLSVDGAGIYDRCLKKGLLINCTQEKILRIMPPITVTKKEIDEAVSILDGVLNAL